MDNKSTKEGTASAIISKEEFKKLYEENNGFNTNLKNFNPDVTALREFIRDEPENPKDE